MKKQYIGMVFLLIVLCLMVFGCSESAVEPTDQGEQKEQKMVEAFPDIAYGPVDGKSESDYKFGFSFGGIAAYADPVPDMANLAASELGIPEIVVQTPQNWIQNEQNQMLDGMIASGITGIFMMPSEATAGNEQITKMVDAGGVHVVCIGGPPDLPSKATLTLATDVETSAYNGTIALIEALGGEGNIVALSGMINDTNTIKRFNGVERAVAEYPNITLVQKIADIEDPEKSMAAVGDLLAARSSEIDGIIATAYFTAAATATHLMKDEYSHIKAVGIDWDDRVIEAIKADRMVGTMMQNPWGQAYISVYTLKMLVDGWTYKAGQPELVDSGFYLVTKENVDEIEEEALAVTQRIMSTWTDRFNPPPSN